MATTKASKIVRTTCPMGPVEAVRKKLKVKHAEFAEMLGTTESGYYFHAETKNMHTDHINPTRDAWNSAR